MAIFRFTPDRDRPNGWHILTLAQIPVTIEPSFLLLLVICFLVNMDHLTPIEIGLWCFIVFFSVLVHEFGHAFTAKAAGCDRVRVSLQGMGGLAFHSPTTRGRSLAIIGAGPAAGMMLGLAALAVARKFPGVFDVGRPGAMYFVIGSLVEVNLFWNLFNLIPIHPLDGGQGLFHLLTYVMEPNAAMLFVARLSMLLCVVVGAVAWNYGLIFVPIFCLQFFMANMEISRALGGMR